MRARRIQRVAGLIGLAGALLFFCGDMLFYGHWGSGAEFHNGMLEILRHASRTRLFLGGLIGPIAACMCIAGFWHVRLNIAPRLALLGWLVFATLAIMMVGGGAVHALWIPRGLAIKYSDLVSPTAPDLIVALKDYWQIAFNVAAVPGYIGAILLLVAVLSGKSDYPRWTVATNFGLISLLEPLAHSVPAPLGAILVGGSLCFSRFHHSPPGTALTIHSGIFTRPTPLAPRRDGQSAPGKDCNSRNPNRAGHRISPSRDRRRARRRFPA